MFKVPSTIKKVATMTDRGLRLTVDTNELDPKDQAELFSLKDKFGWFLFKETKFEESDVLDLPDIKPEFKGDKTPSQRMRGIIYVIWEKLGSQKTFEEFYKSKVEEINTWLKDKYLD